MRPSSWLLALWGIFPWMEEGLTLNCAIVFQCRQVCQQSHPHWKEDIQKTTFQKVLYLLQGGIQPIHSAGSIDAVEHSSVPKMFGRTIRGCGSKLCEGRPFSCRHSWLLLKEQVTEGWQLLLRNLTAMFNASKAFRKSPSREGKPQVA